MSVNARFGFGTNGLGNHRLPDALRLLADLGYDGVALTLDTGHLDPYGDDFERDLPRIARLLDQLGLAVIVETGARYLLDPRRKHHPTLISEGSDLRVDFLDRAIRVGAELGAQAVSLWSGVAPGDVPESMLWERLVHGCSRVVTSAEHHGVQLGFEPEPGMLVENIAGYERLAAELGDPRALGLTLDIGHCRCLEELTVPDCVRRAGDRLVNVQIEDMRRGVHEHLEFGEGEIDFPPVLAALDEIGYTGLIAVELPRHSHDGPGAAMRSIDFLRDAASRASAAPSPRELVAQYAKPGGAAWLEQKAADVARDPAAIRLAFPAAGLRCGKAPAGASGLGVDDAARIALLDALDLAGPERVEELTVLYQQGDAAERRGVLRALDYLDRTDAPGDGIGGGALPLVLDAIRCNDTRLISAALGDYAARRLDDDSFRQAVLKCVFTGIPLKEVAGLEQRTDAELVRMFEHYAAERRAAGRVVPEDVTDLLDRSAKSTPEGTP